MSVCPRPDKRAHSTAQEAEEAMTALRASGGVRRRHETRWLSVYRCVCGSWHVGDQRPLLESKIRSSLRASRD